MSHPPLDDPGPGNGWDLVELIVLTIVLFVFCGLLWWAVSP